MERDAITIQKKRTCSVKYSYLIYLEKSTKLHIWLIKWVNLAKLKLGLKTRGIIMWFLATQIPFGLQRQHQIFEDGVRRLAPINASRTLELDLSSRTECHDFGHSFQAQDGVRIFNKYGVFVGPEKQVDKQIKNGLLKKTMKWHSANHTSKCE